MANPWKDAEKKQKQANDDLDSVRREKRRASTQTTSDVHRKVLETATREKWIDQDR